MSLQSGKSLITNDNNPVKIPVGIDLDGRSISNIDYVNSGIIASSRIGQINGVAELDNSGHVPAAQLPSYVDDVIEVASSINLPNPGEIGKIYVVIDTGKIYRWAGSVMMEISPSAGNSDTATKLVTARTIALSGNATGSISFDGSENKTINVTITDNSHNHIIGNVDGLQSALDGKLNNNANAVSATKLNTSRKIGGVDFDGSVNINLPGVNIAGNQNTSGSAASATNCSRSVVAGTGLSGGGQLNANRTLTVSFGSTSSTVCVGNDARLSNSRKCNNNFDNVSVSRSNLGLTDAATTTVSTIRSGTTKSDVGLSSVDNYSRSYYDGRYLGVSAKAADADKLDGINSSQFLRSDTSDTHTSNLTINGTLYVKTAIDLRDSDKLRFGSSDDCEMYHSGSHMYMDIDKGNFYIRDGSSTRFTFDDAGHFTATGNITANYFYGKASDADKLDGINSSSFLRSDANDTHTGNLTINGTLSVGTAIDLADNDKLRLGSSDDCELFCNGSHMYMDLNSGIGNFYIRDGSTTRFTFDDAGHFTATGNITATTFNGNLSGNSTTATKLSTSRLINGVSFDGSSNITIEDSTKINIPTNGSSFIQKSGSRTDVGFQDGARFELYSDTDPTRAANITFLYGSTPSNGVVKFTHYTGSTWNTTCTLNSNGHFTATKYYGDGSELTGIEGGSIDDQFSALSTSNMIYNESDDITEITYTTGNKLVTDYNNGMISSIKYYDTNGTTLLKTQTIGYDNNDNVNSIVWS